MHAATRDHLRGWLIWTLGEPVLLSRKAIMTEVDHGLTRIGTDYIDLYRCTATITRHRSRRHSKLFTISSNSERSGTSVPPRCSPRSANALHLEREHGWARFVSMQDHYNLLAREEERALIPLRRDQRVATIVWRPLARR
jgi:aryl-alcohol dehydrogenase-like predicted oxidoreductase